MIESLGKREMAVGTQPKDYSYRDMTESLGEREMSLGTQLKGL